MAFFGNSWDEEGYSSKKINQCVMYGIVVPFNKFNCQTSIDNDEIQGIFSGRDGKFIILGKVLHQSKKYLGEDNPFEIPKLSVVDEDIVKYMVFDKYGVTGKFNYYFITNH